MPFLIDPHDLTPDQVEEIEKVSMRYVCQALFDFREEAESIFRHSPDRHTEVAEDATREALSRLPGFPLGRRIFGTMDYKRAGYLFLADYHVRQALLVDSKAEKTTGKARLQLSQTSLPIWQLRGRDRREVREQGLLGTTMPLGGHAYLTTTLFVHYHYRDITGGGRTLHGITVFALPNGLLAGRYVVSPNDSIYAAGANAGNERFRTRVDFDLLKEKCNWRVQTIRLTEPSSPVPPADPLVWDD